VRLGRSEQHTVGHDRRRPPTGLQQPQEEREEQQLGLPGFDDALQILGGVLVIQRPGERRIGEHHRIVLSIKSIGFGQRVAVAHIGMFDTVQQHVHRPDPQHCAVEVETGEHLVVKVASSLPAGDLVGVMRAYVLGGCDQESARSRGRVDDGVAGFGRHHLDDQLDDVSWGAELAVLPDVEISESRYS
jgi:hypothetical protein